MSFAVGHLAFILHYEGACPDDATQAWLVRNKPPLRSWEMHRVSREGGIRTHDELPDKLVFKTRAINHSTTSPTESVRWTFTESPSVKKTEFELPTFGL